MVFSVPSFWNNIVSLLSRCWRQPPNSVSGFLHAISSRSKATGTFSLYDRQIRKFSDWLSLHAVQVPYDNNVLVAGYLASLARENASKSHIQGAA
jgi:hypothetical protein